MWQNFEAERIEAFIQIDNTNGIFDEIDAKSPSSTWTYLVSDDPFEGNLRGQFLKRLFGAFPKHGDASSRNAKNMGM